MIRYLRSKKPTVASYVDMNPRVVVKTPNLRFPAYRTLRKLKTKAKTDLTREEKALIGLDTISHYSEADNFIGDYEIVPYSFEIVGQPWRVGLEILPWEEKILTNWKGKDTVLSRGVYSLEEVV